jgi:hypothetical protein
LIIIKPRKVGGETTLENLACSCFGCNAYKHTKTESIDPETNQKISLFNPHQQSWDDHFKWSDNNTELVGKTPHARSTILILRLNRPGIFNLRRLLITVNLHPPI